MLLTTVTAEYRDGNSLIAIPAGFDPALLWLLVNGQVWTAQNFTVSGGNIVIEDEDISAASIQVTQPVNAAESPLLATVSSESGELVFELTSHIPADYVVFAETDAPKRAIEISEKKPESFLISVKSHGVHFSPQPVDCSENPVTVSLKIIGG